MQSISSAWRKLMLFHCCFVFFTHIQNTLQKQEKLNSLFTQNAFCKLTSGNQEWEYPESLKDGQNSFVKLKWGESELWRLYFEVRVYPAGEGVQEIQWVFVLMQFVMEEKESRSAQKRADQVEWSSDVKCVLGCQLGKAPNVEFCTSLQNLEGFWGAWTSGIFVLREARERTG